MTTINFTVTAPAGAPIGTVNGITGPISTYLISNASSSIPTDVVFGIAPVIAASGPANYTVLPVVNDTMLPGPNPSLSSLQVNALEGLFSHYLDGGNMSFATQEAVTLAGWKIADPNINVSGVPTGVLSNASALVTEALAGDFTIDPHLDFVTYLNQDCNQSFVSAFDPVPLPPSLGLLMSAVLLLTALILKKKFSFRPMVVQAPPK